MSPAGEVKAEVSGYVTWSPDGAYLAVAGESRPPEVWDTTTWEVVTRFGMQCDTVVWNPAFTATGRAP
jgi:WD40 repeat protein